MKSKRARDAAATAGDAPRAEIPPENKRKRGDHDHDHDHDPGEEVKPKKAKLDKAEKRGKRGKKKDKKDKRESRKERKDKRKNIQDVPEEDAVDQETGAPADDPSTSDAAPAKKQPDRTKTTCSATAVPQSQPSDDPGEQASAKKRGRRAKHNEDDSRAGEPAPEPAEGDDAGKGKRSRHIVFVGNLPFSATAESIKAHFASLQPISVRCLTNRDDGNPCRGIAFVEFANVWTMRTCLDKLHHSVFEDGVSAPRKINVELTAGGGGKTKHRQDRITEKNKKLDENRARRIEKEKAAKQHGGRAGEAQDQSPGEIHPSRLARNPRLAR
ncbi:uncharacterized protein UV8b_04090 [Ustilaginoidea virens]|uniref:RRM domain-containing protein n=1 Tax=Ustilaginoidea virens TaxID=1159556 RepID=A0A1B5KWB0_USTVR|nr:uncharacterized protein UV8b_04090 [Ustilaginoidea virens]QUC19849.1 hypothetical protein UV8b_04090 [Ustilaginoidea virens]GAO14850.1 hypothetical protein UVI_02005770 [Ustilaginoidea virens]